MNDERKPGSARHGKCECGTELEHFQGSEAGGVLCPDCDSEYVSELRELNATASEHRPMTREEFSAFASELGERFRGTGTHWIVIVAPPGSFTNETGPHSAGNMPVRAQIETLRGIAASLESNAAVEFIKKRL